MQLYQTTGLFSKGKVIFLKRLYKNVGKQEIVEDISQYISDGSSQIHIVLWDDQKVPSNTRYLKVFKKYKCDIEIKDLNKRSFMSWANEEVCNAELSIDREVLQQFVQKCNYSPESFISEVEKLKLLGKKEITSEQLDSMVANTLEIDIWTLVDGINGKGDIHPSVIVDKLLKQRVDAYYILAMIIRNTRLLVQAKFLDQNGFDRREIASILKVPPFKTILIGFGMIGSGYAEDPVMRKYFRYACFPNNIQEIKC